MPNHCENDLWISGPSADVDALLAKVGANETPPRFDFNAVIPYPEEFAALDRERDELGYEGLRAKYGEHAKDGFNSGGYEWCHENWGTKWNAYAVARRDYGGVCITFQTAWAPPIPVIRALSAQFPTCRLSLEYFECGMEFCGGLTLNSLDDVENDECEPEDEWKGTYKGRRGG